MVALRSLVFGNLPKDSSIPMLKVRTPQEFVRDEVLIASSLSHYERMTKANDIISSGKSLLVESGMFRAEPLRCPR